MVFIEDVDFERLLEKISTLEAERDRALLRSVESARKLQLTEGQLAELCDIKTKLLYSSEKTREGATNDDDGGEDGVLPEVPADHGGAALVSPESTCSPVDQLVSEVEKLTSWWTDGWREARQLIVPLSATEREAAARHGASSEEAEPLLQELREKAEQCARLERELEIFDSRLRVEQKFSQEKVAKARGERDDARTSAREALKRLATLQVTLQKAQERCGQSEKEMIAARSERAELAAEVSCLKEEVEKKVSVCLFVWLS